jgi:hypothetical protein
MGHTGVRAFIMNCFYRETDGAGTRNGKTERFKAGNGRYPGGTSREITGRYQGKKPEKGLPENNKNLWRIPFILAQNKKRHRVCRRG